MSAWDLTRNNFDRNIAIIIGINDYQNGIHQLKTAVNDARAVADILEKEYEYQEVIRLFTPHGEATLAKLNELLSETLPNQIKPTEGDRLLFYFAGHGIARNSEDGPAGALIPQDAQLGKWETYLPMRKLNEALSGLNSHHLLVILDCCFAGNFRWSSSRNVISALETIHREHYDRFIRYPAWQAITSAAHNQEALDYTDERGIAPDNQHSPFAKALINGLKDMKADLTGDKVITAPELYLYLRDSLMAQDGYSELQTAGLWPLQKHDRGEFIFTLPSFVREELKPAPPLDENNNPYRGLQSFDEKHARFFFGRQQLINQLSVRVSRPTFRLEQQLQLTAVLGISGSGKSSLVKAGLISNLRKATNSFEVTLIYACIITSAILQANPDIPLKFLPISYAHQWQILDPIRPGESPFNALAKAIFPLVKTQLTEQLSQVNFIDNTLQARKEEEVDNKSEHKWETLSTAWNNATPLKKLLLLGESFNDFVQLCNSSEESAHLNDLKDKIQLELNQLADNLKENNESINNILSTWIQANPRCRILLTIDQFEELITMSRQGNTAANQPEHKDDIQQLFLALLVNAVKNCPQLHIVLTLRSDFEPRFIQSALKEYWTEARFPVRAMNLDELRQAIEQPAAEMALYFEPANLVNQLIDEVSQMPGALPLLSFTLSELYVKLHQAWVKDGKQERALSVDEEFYKQGGIAGSLSRRANEIYDGLLDDAHRDTMRRVMLRMVTLEGGEPVRRRVPLSELNYANKQEPTQLDEKENQRVKVVLESLDKARLVVSGQETGEPYVEPAHDFLVKGWDKLQKWQENEREYLLLQRRLTPVALEWKNKELSSSFLGKAEPILIWFDKQIDLAGEWFNKIKKDAQQRRKEKKAQFLWNGNPYLDVLRNTLKSRDYWFNQVEAEFVQQSVWQRRRNVNIRWGIAVTVTSIILFGFYVRFQLIEISEKAARAKNLLSSSDSLSGLLLAIQATGQSQSLLKPFLQPAWASVQSSLRDAVEIEREINVLPAGQVQSITFNPRGHNFKTKTATGEERLWNLDGSPSNNLLRQENVNFNTLTEGENFAQDRQKIIRIVKDNDRQTQIVQILDLNRNILENRLFYDVHLVAVRSDGKYAVTAGYKQGSFVKVWDLQGNSVDVFSKHTGAVTSVAISPDGQTIVSGSKDKTVRLWNLQGKSLILEPKHKDVVTSVAISPDGQTIVSGSQDKTVRLWGANGKFIRELIHPNSVEKVAISPDGKKILSVSSEEDYKTTVYLWDFKGNLIHKISPDTGVSSIAFYDNNTILVAGNGNVGSLDLWNLNRQKIAYSFEDQLSDRVIGNISSIAVSFDKKTIVAGGINGIYLWDQQGKIISQPFPGSEHTSDLTLSKDSQYIVSADAAGRVRLWDRQGNLIGKDLQIPDPEGSVTPVAISPNGHYIVIGDSSGTVRLWRAGNWQTWLHTACNRLRYHSIFINYLTDVARGAKKTCEQYVWKDSNLSKQSLPISQGEKSLIPTLLSFEKQDGITSIEIGDFKTAIESLKAHLKNTPNDPEALIYLNNALIGKQKSYTIAIAAPIGSDVNGALEMLRGVAQAQKEINQAGGINKVPLRILIADDNNQPDTAKKIAEKLVKNPDVLGVVGHYASDVTLATRKVYQAGKLVAVSPTSTSVKLTGSGDYIFRTVPNDSVAAKALADYMRKQLHKKTAAVFYNSQSGYSESLKSEFVKFIRQQGGESKLIFDLSAPDFDADQSVQKSIGSDAEVLVLLPNAGELDYTLLVVKANKKRLPLLGGDDVYTPKTLEIGAEDAVGLVVAVPWHISASQTDFPKTSRDLWRADVNWRSAMSYDATIALIEGLKNNPTREGLAQTLRSKDFTANGATGEIKFNQFGDRDQKIQLVKIKENSKSRSGYDYDFEPVN